MLIGGENFKRRFLKERKMKAFLLMVVFSLSAASFAEESTIVFSGTGQQCQSFLSEAQTTFQSQRIAYAVTSSCRYCQGCTLTQQASIRVMENASVNLVQVSGGGDDCDRNMQATIRNINSGPSSRVAVAAQACTFCQGCTYTKNGSVAVIDLLSGGGSSPSPERIRSMVNEALANLNNNNTLEAKRVLMHLERLLRP